MESAKSVLLKNNTRFNNQLYNQIENTTMGTIFAPTYGTLSIGYIEIKLCSACTFKYGKHLAEYNKEKCNCFLDDCYIDLWSRKISSEELLLKSVNPSIQFTMEYSKHQILFLDILIKRNGNGISINLCHNPTEITRCLRFTCSHPNHCKRNNSFCLEGRICTTAKNNTEKLKNLENVKLNLSEYNYPGTLVLLKQ